MRNGFYPRDLELKLPEQGEVSDALEHSEPDAHQIALVRRVMARVGLRCEAASSAERLQRAARAPPAELSPLLIVAADGSMLLTSEER